MIIIDPTAMLTLYNEYLNILHVKNKYKENSTYILQQSEVNTNINSNSTGYIKKSKHDNSVTGIFVLFFGTF